MHQPVWMRAARVAVLCVTLSWHAVFASSPLTDAQNAAIDAALLPYSKNVTGNAPGLAVSIVREGQLVAERYYGQANLDYGAPVTADTVFGIASTSKQFTAFAIALLEREGKVDPNADIRTYLPYVPDFGTPIRVRHLYYQTSGLRELQYILELGRQNNRLLKQDFVADLVARQQGLSFTPGTQLEYCNTNWVLLADIVRRVSGLTLRQFADQRIFKPLGMTSTFFHDNVGDIVPGRALPYVRGEGGWRREQIIYPEIVGPTGVVTTVRDLAKWAANFSDPKVGDRALIERITAPGTLDDGTTLGYAYGLYVTTIAGYPARVHAGRDGTMGDFVYLPEQKLAIAMTANNGNIAAPSSFPDKTVLENLVKVFVPVRVTPGVPLAKAVKVTAANAAALVGTWVPAPTHEQVLKQTGSGYWWSSLQWPLRIAVREGQLELAPFPNSTSPIGTPLTLRKDDVLIVASATNLTGRYFRIIRSAAGVPVAMSEHNEGYRTTPRPVLLQRVPDVQPSAAELAAFVGDYRSRETDTTYRLSLEQGRLVARSLWKSDYSGQPSVFVPVTTDRFEIYGGSRGFNSAIFERDAEGKPARFRVQGPNGPMLYRVSQE